MKKIRDLDVQKKAEKWLDKVEKQKNREADYRHDV